MGRVCAEKPLPRPVGGLHHRRMTTTCLLPPLRSVSVSAGAVAGQQQRRAGAGATRPRA